MVVASKCFGFACKKEKEYVFGSFTWTMLQCEEMLLPDTNSFVIYTVYFPPLFPDPGRLRVINKFKFLRRDEPLLPPVASRCQHCRQQTNPKENKYVSLQTTETIHINKHSPNKSRLVHKRLFVTGNTLKTWLTSIASSKFSGHPQMTTSGLRRIPKPLLSQSLNKEKFTKKKMFVLIIYDFEDTILIHDVKKWNKQLTVSPSNPKHARTIPSLINSTKRQNCQFTSPSPQIVKIKNKPLICKSWIN